MQILIKGPNFTSIINLFFAIYNVISLYGGFIIRMKLRGSKIKELPVVSAGGGAEVVLKRYIRSFLSIEFACAVR